MPGTNSVAHRAGHLGDGHKIPDFTLQISSGCYLFSAAILPIHASELKDVAGYWNSPRHSYLYKPDGTWTMLPEEPGVAGGCGKVVGDIFSTGKGPSGTLKITKLTAKGICRLTKQSLNPASVGRAA